jgi:LmbE family N-acetylglucosaminyl deacetylase
MTAFGVPDRGATARLVDIVDSLRSVIETVRPAVVVTHAYEGGHPDHDAIAFAARAATASCTPPVDLVEFAAYHEGAGGQLITNRFSDSWQGVLPLVPEQRRLKRLMLACFQSQRRVLAAFDCDYESLRIAAPVDFTRPPASGAVWFDRRGWGVTGATWREQVAVVAAQLAAQGMTCLRS